MAGSITSLDYTGGPAPVPDPTPPPHALARRFAEDFSTAPFPLRWLADGDFMRWFPSGTASDRKGGKDLPLYWNELDLRAFRVHARYLADLNPFMIGFLGALVGYHVRKGYGWQCCLRGVKKTPYPTSLAPTHPVVAKGQLILDTWRDAVQWPSASREAFRRWRRDGEVFGRWGYGGWGQMPWFRFVGPERVGSPTGDTNGPDSFGIAKPDRDLAGPALQYHVWDQDNPAYGDWVAGDRVVHVTANVDAEVKRGVPDSLPLQQDLDGVRRLLRNMLVTAGDQAAVAWLEGFPTATAAQVGALIPQYPDQQRDPYPTGAGVPWWLAGYQGTAGWGSGNNIRPGSILRTEGNRAINGSPYSQGVPNYIEVEEAAIGAMCFRWGFPKYVAGKTDDVNFAAALTTTSPFAAHLDVNQDEWGSRWERPAALKVLDLAVTAGLLTPDERRLLDVEATPPANVTPEPDKDAQRAVSLVTAGILSKQTAQLQLQLDPQHEAENIRATQQPGGGGDPDPSGDPSPGPQPGDGAAGTDLKGTVGGLQAIRDMQTAFYAGQIPRAAAVSAMQILFGFTPAEAGNLFPDVKPVDRTDPLAPPGPAPTREQIDRVLREHGFTGLDRLGRKWVDGKEVPKDAGGPAGSNPPKGDPASAPPSDLSRDHVAAGLPDLIARADPEVAKTPGLVARLTDHAVTAAAKVYARLVQATPAILKVIDLAGAVIDTPEDMKRWGYNPTTTGPTATGAQGQHGDWFHAHFGVSTHLAATLATAVLSKALVAAKRKLGLAEGEAGDAFDAAGELLAAVLKDLAGEYGLATPPDAAAIAARLRALAGSKA